MSIDTDVQRLRAHGLSQEAIAQRLGVSRWQVRQRLAKLPRLSGRVAGEPLTDTLERLYSRAEFPFGEVELDAAALTLDLAEREDELSRRDLATLERVAVSLADGWTLATNGLIGIRLRLLLRGLAGDAWESVTFPEWLSPG